MCPPERNALSDFYDSAKGAEWTDRTNWQDEYVSYCDWKGVTCDNDTNQVIKLNLTNNNLSGRLSESIGKLTSIEVLDLSDNDIKGSIPTEIGLLANLTYLRLSYNAFTGAAPESLGELTKLQLLQLQSNRITEMPNIPRLDESIFNESAFVTDCGVPSAFEEALECDNCTMCCNANDDCYPQEDNRVGIIGISLIAGFVALCCVVVLYLYFSNKRKYGKKNRKLSLSMSKKESRTKEETEYALSKIGKDSVYSYFVAKSRGGWQVAFSTLVVQAVLLEFFVFASKSNLQDDKIDIQFSWKCPRDSAVCKDYSDLEVVGWVFFALLMIAHLAKDFINGSKLMYFSSRVRYLRYSLGSRIRYFIGGVSLCTITLFALYVSIVYNWAIATSNTEIIVNSVIVLFVMDLDERVFAALEAWNEDWTSHAASDSKSTTSLAVEAENSGTRVEVKEMKLEIKLQKAQIADQQKEIEMLRSQQNEFMLQNQKYQMARQNEESPLFHEAVQNMQDPLAASDVSESISLSRANEV